MQKENVFHVNDFVLPTLNYIYYLRTLDRMIEHFVINNGDQLSYINRMIHIQ